MNMPTRAFIKNYSISVSTLSPVHIGCDEDYEPTNYVMYEQCLHHFDIFAIADLLTDDDRKVLDEINRSRSPLLALQKFFFDRKAKLITKKDTSRVASYDVFKKYIETVGKPANIEASGKQIINDLKITRTAFNTHNQQPILPGSSIKGAIRTAILNERNQGKETRLKPKELEKDLLKGAFETDPLRLLKVGDALFDNNALLPKIMFENNVRRIPVKAGKPTRQLLSLMREAIPEYNYAAFSLNINIQDLIDVKNEKTPQLKISLNAIAKHCNAFYVDIFKREMKRFIQRGCLKESWVAHSETTLQLLQPFIQNNAGMVVRVGRHSGAESVTIDGVRSIKIMKGPGKSPSYEKIATTDWLVGEQEKSEVDLMPFGWLFFDFNFVELEKDRQALAEHFATISAYLQKEQAEKFQKVDDDVVQLMASIAEEQKIAQEKMEKQKAERFAEEQKQAALAAMPPEQQAMQKLRERKEKGEDKNGGASGKLADDLRLLCESAASWQQVDKDSLYELVVEVLLHLGVDRKSNAKWKARLAGLKG